MDMTGVKNFFRSVFDLLAPSLCSYCKSSLIMSDIPYFCKTCWSEFDLIRGSLCPCCGRQFASPEALSESPSHLCRFCRENPPYFDQALSVGLFEGQLREAIHIYKYKPLRALGKPLADWMAKQIRLVHHMDIVMPVPLHRSRLRQRGFNQSLLLAYGITEHFSLSIVYDNLIRTRPTRPQVELSADERAKNVRGAFALRHPGDVFDKRILLVDDVFTTGSTLNECAKVLKESGASSVTAFTLARTSE